MHMTVDISAQARREAHTLCIREGFNAARAGTDSLYPHKRYIAPIIIKSSLSPLSRYIR